MKLTNVNIKRLRNRTIFIFALSFIMFLVTLDMFSQVVEQWIARYNGPGNSSDKSYALAIDSAGNVYIAGDSIGSGTKHDYTTIKYNSTGVEQWVRRYNGPGNDEDFCCAMVIDSSGNVYVTGCNTGLETRYDYTTIKYDNAGVEQWVARYDSPGNGSDWAMAIEVDSVGNVYVTGFSLISGVNSDYATIKYNSAGVEQWVTRYNGPGNSTDWAWDIAVDSVGSVYVTGYSVGSGTDFDYATIKYNSGGVEQWVARYNGPGNDYDEPRAIGLDSMGNVYVTGGSTGSGNKWDYATIKYNNVGVEQWVARYNGPGDDSDFACALTIDDSDNVYITGGSGGSGTLSDYATVKYNNEGVEQWVTR